MDSTLSHWTEWNERCALALCGEETRQALRAFGSSRFRHYARVVAGNPAAGVDLATGDHWHLFETHLALRQTRDGKRYKDWLFARVAESGDPPLDVIQGGAGLLMRDVVRAFVRAERPQRGAVSLDEPLRAGGEGTFTLNDLLPAAADPAQDMEAREFSCIAEGLADACFVGLAARERIAFAAREQGLPLSHPAVERCAGCGKSTLHAALSDAVGSVADRIRASYPDEAPATIRLLARLTLRGLGVRALSWAISEKGCARLFSTRRREMAVA